MGNTPSQNPTNPSAEGSPPYADLTNAKLYGSKGLARVKAVHKRIRQDRMRRDAEERVLIYNFDLEAQLQERNQTDTMGLEATF